MMRLVCLVALATVAMGMPPSRPWELLMKAVDHVSESNDNTLKFVKHEEPFELQWQSFKSLHSKSYPDAKEEMRRRAIFKNNLKGIEMHNYLHAKGESTFTLGINEYSDMEHSEFVKVMNGLLPRNKSMVEHHAATYLSPNVPFTLPSSVDWRTKGYVTPVKNQGQCGSCWSFSTTGSLEGQHFRSTGKLVSLSEQNLVDCSKEWGNHGCSGGLMDYAFKYIFDNKGDDTEQSYPYEALDGPCRFKKSSIGATDKGFTDVLPQGDEDKLQEATATVGPISIAIDASHASFQQYQGGVYVEPECSSTQLDHGVLIVGYGTSEDGDFWIVKNSWGPTWGLDGYIKMARNKDNQCGVATQASYPNV